MWGQRGRGIYACHLLPKQNIYSFPKYFLQVLLCAKYSSNMKQILHKRELWLALTEFTSLVKNTDQQTAFPSYFRAISKLRFIFQLSPLLHKLKTLQKNLTPNAFFEIHLNQPYYLHRYFFLSPFVCYGLSQNNRQPTKGSSILTLLLQTFLRAQ